jgi:hypothetical protein
MNTNTLVVVPKVLMKSGMYGREGRVVKVTERYVEVELPEFVGPIGLKSSIRFDAKTGKACDSSDIYHENMWGGDDPSIPGTHEFGPWELIDVAGE